MGGMDYGLKAYVANQGWAKQWVERWFIRYCIVS